MAQVLKKAAQQSGDARLALLASRVSKTDPLATGSHFDQVIAAIDKMIGTQRNKEQERADFEEAEKEMNQAIAALDKDVKELAKATEDHKEGTLLQAKVDLSEGFAERTAEALFNCNRPWNWESDSLARVLHCSCAGF